MHYRAQINAATGRFRETAEDRATIERRKARDGVRVVDSPDQLEARIDRLTRAGLVRPESVLGAVPRLSGMNRTLLLENIIDLTNDLQAANFLSRGARAARTVGRIVVNEMEPCTAVGTGFLVAPSLVMTNHHVLPDEAAATEALLELNYERDVDNHSGLTATYRLDPHRLFLTDEGLDYTVVAVAPGPDDVPPGAVFGWNSLIREQGKVVIGEPVNVIGHPMGRRKEIAIRSNSVLLQLDHYLQYSADTLPGSSGSPAFNDQWEVVALHHASIPATDDEGNWLSIDGTVVDPEEPDQVRWIANEGVRISVVLTHLLAGNLTGGQRALLDTLGPQALPATAARLERVAERFAGLRAGGPAGASGVHLVFLHGRGQRGRDPQRMRSAWLAGLGVGLGPGLFAPIDPADVWFPFYAEALPTAGGPLESLAGLESDEVLVDYRNAVVAVETPPDGSTRRLYVDLLEEAASATGMPVPVAAGRDPEGLLDGVVRRVRRSLGWLADRSRLDELVIATVFRDVAAYLDQAEVREQVLAAVLDCLPASGRMVLVGHSLGSVVAADLIARLPTGLTVDALVTAGSPLGLDTITGRLLTGGPPLAAPVGSWVNAWCAADAVAVGCPLSGRWPGVIDVMTDNAESKAHDIAEYLSDARIGQAIGVPLR